MRAAGAAWLLLIGWLTLRSAPEQADRVALLPWSCIVCGDAGVADVILNIILFLPLGIVARELGYPLRRMLCIVVPITIGIELTQGFVLTGRDAALGDVLANSAGGLAGWLAAPVLERLLFPDRAIARRAVPTLICMMTAIWCGTATGLRPALGGAAPWVGQIQHRWASHRPFAGRVHDVTLNGVEVSNDPLATVPDGRDTITLRLGVTRDRTSDVGASGQSTMLRIVDDAHRPQLSVAARGANLLFEPRLAVTNWKLHTPTWLFGGALALHPDADANVELRATAASVSLDRVVAGETNARWSSHNTIGIGWVFIHPFVATLDGNATLWTILWLGWWFGGLGWLGAPLGAARSVVTGALGVACYLATSSAYALAISPVEVSACVAAFTLATTMGMLRVRRMTNA